MRLLAMEKDGRRSLAKDYKLDDGVSIRPVELRRKVSCSSCFHSSLWASYGHAFMLIGLALSPVRVNI